MARNKKWEFSGYTELRGKIYNKGAASMVLYNSGAKRYWRVFPGSVTVFRTKSGREKWWEWS